MSYLRIAAQNGVATSPFLGRFGNLKRRPGDRTLFQRRLGRTTVLVALLFSAPAAVVPATAQAAGTVTISANASTRIAPGTFGLTASYSSEVNPANLVWDLDADGQFDDGSGPSVTVARGWNETGSFAVSVRVSTDTAVAASKTLTAQPWNPSGVSNLDQGIVDVSPDRDGMIVVNSSTGDLGLSVVDIGGTQIGGIPLAARYHSLRTDAGELGRGASLSWGRDITAAKLAAPHQAGVLLRGPDAAEAFLPAGSAGFDAQRPWKWTDELGNPKSEASSSGGAKVSEAGGTAKLELSDATSVSFGALPTSLGVDDASGRARATSAQSEEGTFTFAYDASTTGGWIQPPDQDDRIDITAGNGRISEIVADGAGYNLSYDAGGRMTSVQVDSVADTATRTLTWTNDRVTKLAYGNRTYKFSYDGAGRVTQVAVTVDGVATLHTFTYGTTTTTHSASGASTSYELSGSRSVTSGLDLFSRRSVDSSPPAVEVTGERVSGSDSAYSVAWVASQSDTATVRISAADEDYGLASVVAGGRTVMTGVGCAAPGLRCPRTAQVEFTADPGATGANAWPSWQTLQSGGGASASVSCSTITARDAANNLATHKLCLAVDTTAPYPSDEAAISDVTESGKQVVAWGTPARDPAEPSMKQAFEFKGIDVSALSSGIAREEFRYKRPQDSSFTPWSSAASAAMGQVEIPGLNSGDMVQVETRSFDLVGRASEITSSNLNAIAATDVEQIDGPQPPSAFTGGGSRTLKLQVVDGSMSDGEPYPSPLSRVRIQDGSESINQTTDGDGIVEAVGITSSAVNVWVNSETTARVVNTQPSGSTPTTVVDVTGQWALLPSPSTIIESIEDLKKRHPKLASWCFPKRKSISINVPLSAFKGLRGKTCLMVRNAGDQAVAIASRAYAPAGTTATGAAVTYDGTRANALQHALWGTFVYIGAKRSLPIKAGPAKRAFRDLYEFEQLKGGDATTAEGRLTNRKLSRMDQWNDDRGFDYASNRNALNGNAPETLCRGIVYRSRSSSLATYLPKSAKWQPRPSEGTLIHNRQFVNKSGGDFRKTLAQLYAEDECKGARRTRAIVTCNRPGSGGNIYSNHIILNTWQTGFQGVKVVTPAGVAVGEALADQGAASWSGDRRQIIYSGDDGVFGGLRAKDPAAQGAGSLVSESELFNPSCSPSGASVAYAAPEGLKIRDLATSNDITAALGVTVTSHIAWSPDGTRLAFAGFDAASSGTSARDIYTLNADGTGLSNHSLSTTYSEDRPRWAPDSRHIFLNRANLAGSSLPSGLPSHIAVKDVVSVGGACRQLTPEASHVYDYWLADISPDASSAVVQDDESIRRVTWGSSSVTTVLQGFNSSIPKYRALHWAGIANPDANWARPAGLTDCP